MVPIAIVAIITRMTRKAARVLWLDFRKAFSLAICWFKIRRTLLASFTVPINMQVLMNPRRGTRKALTVRAPRQAPRKSRL